MINAYADENSLKAKTSQWLSRIEPYNQHKLQFNDSAGALMVIDMQKFFLEPESPTFTEGGLAIVPNIVRLISSFRNAGRPVIYTQHVHHPNHVDSGIMGWWWDGMCVENSPESKVINELMPLPHEKIINKHRYSAFYNTDLETVLRCLKIEDLVIAGIMTNLCCESTARDAFFRDYRVFFLADATGSVSEEMHLATLLNLAFGFAYVTTTDDIVGQIK